MYDYYELLYPAYINQVQDSPGDDWRLPCMCIAAVVLAYGVRYYQEYKKEPKPDAKFQLLCSLMVSYLMWFVWPGIKEVGILEMHPFKSVEVVLGISSYMGAYIVRQGDYILKKGWKIWAADFARKVLAYTEKKKEHDTE